MKHGKPSILIVDDNVMSIMSLARLLQDDYDVRIEKDGKSAVEFTLKHLPDLILLDVNMPIMDGYKTISLLKEIGETKSIPIIFITSSESAEGKEKGVALGAADYIIKGTDLEAIKSSVEKNIYESVTTYHRRGLIG